MWRWLPLVGQRLQRCGAGCVGMLAIGTEQLVVYLAPFAVGVLAMGKNLHTVITTP